jgi:Zn-dependent protease with chaperone function
MIEPLSGDPAYTPELREQILASFRGEVSSLRPTWTYRLTLAAVALVMVLLPVFYVGLIAGGLWGLVAYARFLFVSFLPQQPGLGMRFFSFLPLFAGSVVLICLVKPLFARSVSKDSPVRLTPEQEPLLFQFVARLCAALNAPVPKEIRVDCQVNASASFRRGLLSLASDDLVLTLGLPLVAGLSLQQLAGVMAHELGHFSQRAGLRVSVVIRVVNMWFFRLVYQRDRLDAALESAVDKTRFPWIRSYFRITLFFVKMTRRVLWALMMFGHMVSSFLMRQMEYDADRYEVRLAGFSSFDFTMRELFSLNVAHDVTMQDLDEQWKEKRLVDNFPRLLILNRREWVRQIAPQLETYLRNEPEGLFDTHPTARQRTARALREKGVGVFTSDLPATALFYDFDRLAREISLHFYQGLVGNQLEARNLIPLQKVRETQELEESQRGALERFFQNPDWVRGLPLPQKLPALPPDPKIVITELEKARRGVIAKDADHTKEIQSFREAAGHRINALRARALRDAGFRIRPEDFGLNSSDPAIASMEADRAESEMRASASRLEKFEKLEVRRLGLALVLLEEPHVAARLREAIAWRQEYPPLLACAAFLTGKFPKILELRTTKMVLDVLVQEIRPDQPDPQLFGVIADRLETLQEQLKELHRELRNEPYPFEHAREEINLAQVIIPNMPTTGDLGGFIAAALYAWDRLLEIYARLLGRMAWMAEKVEEALGMPVLTKSAGAEAASASEPAAVSGAPLTPAVVIQESKAEAIESRETFPRYFRGVLELRALPLPEPLDGVPDVRAFLAALREAVQAAGSGAEAYTRSVRQYRDAEQRLGRAWQAERLLIAGIPINAESFSLSGEDRAAATAALRRAEGEMEALERRLQLFEEIQGTRLAGALGLLADDRVAGRVPDGLRRRGEIAPLLSAAAAVQRHFPPLRELRRICWGLRGLAAVRSPEASLQEQVREQMSLAHRHLQDLQRLLHREPSPFAGIRGPVSLAQVAVPALPLVTDFDGIYQAAHIAVRDMNDLHQRILGRLAGMAEKVEQALELRAT